MSITEDLGIKRREDKALYDREWRRRNREKNRAYNRDYYHNVTKNDPEKKAAKNRSGAMARRKAKYGISREEYEQRVLTQKGKCLICKEKVDNDLRVDHDHQTGEIRGLLCANCNSGLGFFEEDADRLKLALEYLKTDRGKR